VGRLPGVSRDDRAGVVERPPKVKATCHVLYDQVQLGYGNNAVEAWAMGIPVIAGGAPTTLTEMRRRFGSLPFVKATEDTIGDALALLLDEGERERWGAIGQAHARAWHDEYPVKVAADAYRRAIA
jgi:glycosyltransferase involved in cell wall biosynthesis